jgi:hypothetical protein
MSPSRSKSRVIENQSKSIDEIVSLEGFGLHYGDPLIDAGF